MTIGLEHYLIVSVVLFCLGLLGVIIRRNLIVMYMGLELMLNAANLALGAFSHFRDNLDGQVMVFFIITVAAASVLLSRATRSGSASRPVVIRPHTSRSCCLCTLKLPDRASLQVDEAASPRP